MYVVRNGKVLKVQEIVNESNRKTGVWVIFEGMKKKKLVSKKSLFSTIDEAQSFILEKEAKHKKVELELKQELHECLQIVELIYQEHGVEIPALTWMGMSKGELWSYYCNLRDRVNV
ncbi:hypothetical protein [Niallia taxi]|uniref:hypothetical protein n=1 Tax=Niallia taxi TaxID=2499688 RepID=UPI0015F4B66B|nr:hypothetical protein [Niallia taxi]